MAHTVDTGLLDRIKTYGAFDVSACFNCGNCTAVCPLSAEDSTFPRRLIRYGQVGMEDRLLAEKDLWMCYYCGECTKTCPRQAAPGAYMAAARRYAISRYDRTGISRLLYGSAAMNLLLFVVFSTIFTLLLLWSKGDMNGQRLALFQFVPGEAVHTLGVALMAIIGLAAIGGVVTMVIRFLRISATRGRKLVFGWKRLAQAAGYAIGEGLGQARYRTCDEERTTYPWYRKPWFVHAVIVWGFLGLLAATALDFLFKPIGSSVPLYYPPRLIGTIAGLMALYGLVTVIIRRIRQPEIAYKDSRFSDWFFLLLLFFTVITGTTTEIMVYWPVATLFGYVIFVMHVVLAMDLLVLMPLTKFAHAIYRPMALFLTRWLELSPAG